MWEMTVSEKEAYCMWSISSNERELIYYGDMAILAEVQIACRANMSLCPAGLRLFMDMWFFPDLFAFSDLLQEKRYTCI